jgi:tRNA(Phe) wybutosine-synthesizing methylase Tyw3
MLSLLNQQSDVLTTSSKTGRCRIEYKSVQLFSYCLLHTDGRVETKLHPFLCEGTKNELF